jgi:hypothetical protein
MCHNALVATVRRELRIPRSADEIWEIVGDAGALHEWFPGVVSTKVDRDDEGDYRSVELASGLSLTERIVTNDSVLRRFQYRIVGGAFREHLSTVDVHALCDGTSLVVYGTDAEPAVMALVIGGASGAALRRLDELVRNGDEH